MIIDNNNCIIQNSLIDFLDFNTINRNTTSIQYDSRFNNDLRQNKDASYNLFQSNQEYLYKDLNHRMN